uniref:Putative conserved secreted protein n=1 Tax=Xenopsylla cheopis TaxID=163159 RepID=A0A6M2DW93_XENCH
MRGEIVFISVLLICLWSGASSNILINIDPSADGREVSNCAERGTPGLICTTCVDVAKCVKSGSQWLTIHVERCEAPKACNVKEGGCSTEPGPCTNRPSRIQCKTEGLIPDAFDCQKYHFCARVNEDSNLVECRNNFAFNIKTGKCDLNATNASTCKRLPLKCPKAGYSEAWPEDKNLFYVCVKQPGSELRPEFHRCDHGFVYDNNKQDCVKGHGGGNQGGVPEVCTELGKYPDPKDEDSYYHCVKIGKKPKHKTCDWGETFDPKKLKCVCEDWWC